MINILVGLNADINLGDSMNRRALHYAAAAGNNPVITTLLSMPDIEIDALSLGNETPLMRAVQFGNFNAVEILL